MNRHLKDISRRRHGTGVLFTLIAIVLVTMGASLRTSAANYAVDSRTLLTDQEGCPNGAIDPGETNTVHFVIKKTSDGTQDEVRAELINGGNVDFALSSATSAVSVAKDGTIVADFKFRAGGTCGGSLTPTIRVSWKNGSSRDHEDIAAAAFQIGKTVPTVQPAITKPDVIVLNDFDPAADKMGRASAYPSKLTVAGIPNQAGVIGERVSKVTVTLNNITNSFSSDLNIVLVSPTGKKVALMKNAGNGPLLPGTTLTFDSGGAALPFGTQISSGTYKPADYATSETLPDLSGPYSTDLSVFNVSQSDVAGNANNPNGEWQLYVQDDTAGGSGQILGGWSLSFTTTRIDCCSSDATAFPAISKAVSDSVGGGADIRKPGVPNQEILEDATDSIFTFSVTDAQTTDSTKISVTATSSDQTIIKDANIAVSTISTTENRQIKISKPEANANGPVTITITATDDSQKAVSTTFVLNVKPVNDAPVVSPILGQASNMGTPTSVVDFTVTDQETDANSLNVFAVSDNPAVVPNSNISITGNGSARHIQVTPATTTTTGSARITVTANDGTADSAPVQFQVDFSTATGAPTFTPQVAQTIDEDKQLVLPIVVRPGNGSSTSPSDLFFVQPGGVIDVPARSSNQALVKDQNVVVTGTGSNRTLTITPEPDQPLSGTASTVITLVLRDPSTSSAVKMSTNSFTLTVTAVNDAPTISAIADQTINEDGSTADLAFTVNDPEGTAVTVTAASSNTDVVPTSGISITPSSGSSRVIKITPAANAFGRATITITATDGATPAGVSKLSFNVTVNAVNDAPEIGSAQITTPSAGTVTTLSGSSTVNIGSISEDSGLANANTTTQGTSPVEQQIAITGITPGPGESLDLSASVNLSVSVASDTAGLITDLSITPTTLANNVSAATIKYKLGIDKSGTATFTVTATDNQNATTTRKFDLTVTAVNDPPRLADIPNQIVPKGGQGIAVPITISDVEGVSGVTVTATATPNDVQPIVYNPNNRTLNIVPTTPNAETIAIHVVATDAGGLQAVDDFNLILADVVNPTMSLQATNGSPSSVLTSTNITITEDNITSVDLYLYDDQDINVLKNNLSVTTSNPNLLPTANILPASSLVGNKLTVLLTPVANSNGVAQVTFSTIDGDQLSPSPITVTLTVTPVEDNPTIDLVVPSGGTVWSTLSGTNQITAAEGANPISDDKTSSKLIEVQVSDPETAADALTVAATSSDTTLIPNDAAHLSVSATGTTRTVRIVPNPDNFGLATITVTVTDGAGRKDSELFIVNVTSVNDAPTIDQVAAQTINEDASTTSITLSGIGVGGGTPENTQSITSVTVGAVDKGGSVNTLIDPASLQITAGSDASKRTLSYAPIANLSGTSVITVTVVDNGGTANTGKDTTTMSFELTIAPVNDAPTIRLLKPGTTATDLDPEIPIPAGGDSGVIGVTIADVEAPSNTLLNDLVVTATSDNQAVVADANLQLTGSAGSRGLKVTPSGAQGSANITVRVTDKGQPTGQNVLSAEKKFKVTVQPSDNPTISSISVPPLQRGQFSSVIAFTINDAQTPASSLTLDKTSSNQDAVPLANIQFGGSGSARQMIVKAGNTPGTSQVSVIVGDTDGHKTTNTFPVTVLGDNPTISQIANQTVQKNGSVGPLSLTVNDTETFPGFLQLSAVSSNPTFVPVSGIAFGGSDSARNVTITPAANQEGKSTITITVTDSDGQTNKVSFDVSTPDTNLNAPTISSIPNQQTGVGQNTPLISFTVNDVETSPADLVVEGHSSDQTIVPDGNIFLSKANTAGTDRNLLISPVAGKSGTVTITLTVTDKGATPRSATSSFTLTIADNTAPTISGISNQTVTKNQSTPTISFTVGDAETPGSLNVSGSALNKTLVPDANIIVTGSGATRSVTVTPANNQTGSTTITLTVTDAGSKSASTSFTLTVNAGAVVKGDLTGDGKADIVFQDGDGFLAIWTLNGLNVSGASYLSPSNVGDLNYSIVGTGDFNNDGKEDVLFQNKIDGGLAVWYMDGVNQTDASALSLSPGDMNWKVVGTGDINNDGKVDVVFQHTDGTLAVWFMNGVTVTSAALIDPSNPGDTAWRVVGVGDLTGDGKQDLVFQHTDGTLAYWSLGGANGVTLAGTGLLDPSTTGDAAWRVVGVADRNGDGKADLLLQNNDGTLGIWFLNGTKVTSAGLLNPANPGVSWKAVGPR